MSAAKSKGRPTIAETGTDQVAAESSAVGRGLAAGERRNERSSVRPVKDVVVTVRMTSEDSAALAFVQSELGAASGPDAIREVIRIVAAIQRDETYRSAKAARPVVHADRELLEHIRDALQIVAKNYNDRSREVHFIGHNWNQIAKVANATGGVDANALLGVQRALIEVRKQMAADAERDAKALEVLACLS